MNKIAASDGAGKQTTAQYAATNLPPNVRTIAQALAHRRLGRVALLFLAAHRPAAFLAGQCLYFFSPTYRLFMAGSRAEYLLDDWAALFCRVDVLRVLEPVLLRSYDTPPARPAVDCAAAPATVASTTLAPATQSNDDLQGRD